MQRTRKLAADVSTSYGDAVAAHASFEERKQNENKKKERKKQKKQRKGNAPESWRRTYLRRTETPSPPTRRSKIDWTTPKPWRNVTPLTKQKIYAACHCVCVSA
jgi:hypothetical protein